ncbi:hypothetical protein P3T36_003836 [Kitasatospora sp. MAP12-15]|uniref:hypothetical protein n=1 Tax=unclassified Kitasatospora TaxID=2633591 RepID=UPI002474E558|nr:hypothetical protein [Kitasatospora sp. MAP12-44]MDH6108520.1 hypothetical protein [Kitasatospora sp. MAP12-44]
MSMRTLALPALAASVVLTLSACDPTAPAVQSANPSNAAAQAASTAIDGNLSDTLPPSASQPVTLVTPAADQAQAVAPARSATASPVGPSTGPTGAHTPAPNAASAAPAPSGGSAAATTPDLTLDSYDQKSGKAVLAVAVADAGKPGTPSPAASAATTAAVRPGQLIDSPPSAAAPHGALLAITGVTPATDGKVTATTRPATISELLGQTWADIKSALDPHKIQITPKLKDLKASYVPNPDGGDGSASGALELDANDSIPLPGGATATLNGSLELDPSVAFSYHGTSGILGADQAKVGFDLGAHANWHLTASLSGSTGQVKIPIATLTATPTVMVGTVPVVITLNLTLYAEVSADGTVTVDTTQQVDGDWAIHADYTKAGGWTSATEPVTTKVSPVKAKFTGTANVRSGLVADGSVALYDSLGVKATVEPYLRAAVNGEVDVDSSGAAPTVTGTAGLYGGLDVTGAVMARIAILGTPLLEKDLPFAQYHNEWPIITRTVGNAAPNATATPGN